MLPDGLVGVQGGEGLIGHVLREAFFEPEVVEPAHGGEVAEPLVGEFVEDEDVAAEQGVGGGRGAEEDALFAEEGGAGVLHATVGEAGDENHFIFREGEGLGEIVGEELDALGGGGLDGGDFGFGGVGFRFADPDVGQAGGGMDLDEGSGGKGEEVGGDGFGFVERIFRSVGDPPANPGGVGDDGPAVGCADLKLEAAFEVGLIEAGESHAGVHGDEEGVEVFAAVVFVFEAGDGFAGCSDVGGEFRFDGVGAGMKRSGGQDEVAVVDGGGNLYSVQRESETWPSRKSRRSGVEASVRLKRRVSRLRWLARAEPGCT